MAPAGVETAALAAVSADHELERVAEVGAAWRVDTRSRASRCVRRRTVTRLEDEARVRGEPRAPCRGVPSEPRRLVSMPPRLARHASVLDGPTYSGLRAIAATGGGLRPSATVPAGRGLFGTHRRLGGLRRQSVSAARRQIPRQAQFGDVSDLPQGAVDAGVLGVRRSPGGCVGVCAHRRRTRPAGHPVRRVLCPCGGGMPHLQLESPGQVVCARRDPTTQGITPHPSRAQPCAAKDAARCREDTDAPLLTRRGPADGLQDGTAGTPRSRTTPTRSPTGTTPPTTRRCRGWPP